MEPHDFLDPAKTVWRYEQVLTEADLQNFMDLLYLQYQQTNPALILERACLETSINTVHTLIDWIKLKKPRNFEGME